MRNNSIQGRQIFHSSFWKVSFSILLFSIITFLSFSVFSSQAASGSVKIRYNGKTYKNKSKKMSVKYNRKTVSKKSYKALVIKKNYMVSYTDVFKKGIKSKCVYNKKKKTLSISANGAKLVMTIGKKTATLNKKKIKLPVAPLSVRYVSKKKTKILVPIYSVSKSLCLSYKKSGSSILLGEPLQLSCDNVKTYYTGVQGKVFYNHKLYSPTTLPVIKLSGKMYVPAEETFRNIMKLEYDYNASTKNITIADEDTNKELILTVDKKNAIFNNANIVLSAPPKIIRNHKTKKDIVCLPAATVFKKLSYTSSWNKKDEVYQIQSKEFFHWEKQITEDDKNNKEINTIYKFDSIYKQERSFSSITFQLTGTQSELFKSTTVNRSGNVITITMPKTKYALDKFQFNRFGEIIDKMDVVEQADNIVLSFTCENVADYSYTAQNGVLEISILYTYGSTDGSVISYSLSIKKPAGITIQNVTNQDLYMKKQFVVNIKGDHLAFFQNNPIIINNSNVKSILVTKNGENTSITITTATLVGYKIYDKGDSFEVKVGTPKKVYKNIVVLDAGHGGHDPGAQNKGTNEKDLNFKILYTLMKDYFSSNAPDIKVYWTRTNDSFISLADRASFAKKVGADVFISLHMNSATNTSANGTEVYYSVANNSPSFSGVTSQAIAKIFKTRLVNDLKMKNRGTKTAAYYVLKHNTVPSVLIELGFLSGTSDYSKLINSTFQANASKSIYNGIVSIFNTYKTGR